MNKQVGFALRPCVLNAMLLHNACTWGTSRYGDAFLFSSLAPAMQAVAANKSEPAQVEAPLRFTLPVACAHQIRPAAALDRHPPGVSLRLGHRFGFAYQPQEPAAAFVPARLGKPAPGQLHQQFHLASIGGFELNHGSSGGERLRMEKA